MTPWEAMVLGLVQGLLMFVPVSSTSHLALTQHWLIERGSLLPSPDSPEMILFDLVVHVGSLVSIVVVFRRSLGIFVTRALRGARSWLRGRSSDRLYLRLAAMGAVSVAVTGAVGLPLRSAFGAVFAQPLAIAFSLLLTGALLYWTDSVGPRSRGLRQIGPSIAIVIGLAQGLALMGVLALRLVLELLYRARFRYFAYYV